jgi:hypothetical protein
MTTPTARAVVVALLAPAAAHAYCPSYTASSSANTHNCGVEAAAGDNPSVAEWNDIFAVVAAGPASWGTAGPAVSDLKQGCANPSTVPAHFPCELLKGLAMVESGWKQFCVPETPPDQVGKPSQTMIAFDCGYGIAQVTSGMHVGETPSFDRDRVASDPTYNLATGTQILAQKWRGAPCVGDRQPDVIEDWYSAAWGYNGYAYSNNPNNPNYASNRGVWNPSVGGAAPYQEKIWGYIEHATRFTPVALAYPDLADVGNGSSPPALPEPSCASPTSCAEKRPAHPSACGPAMPTPDAGITPPGSPDASVTPPITVPDAGVAPSQLASGDLRGGCSTSGAGSGGPGGSAAGRPGAGGEGAGGLAALLLLFWTIRRR